MCLLEVPDGHYMTGKCQGIIGPYEKQIQNVFFSETIEPFESNFGLDGAYKNVWFVLCRSEIQSTHRHGTYNIGK